MEKQCDCCKTKEGKIMHFQLPVIGYGSVFDVIGNERFEFNICPKCANKMNRWIKKKYPGVTLDDVWNCEIVTYHDPKMPEGIELQQFKEEGILLNVFTKFMPHLIFGEHYKLRRFLFMLTHVILIEK